MQKIKIVTLEKRKKKEKRNFRAFKKTVDEKDTKGTSKKVAEM